MDNPITIETTVHAPIEKVWEYWTAPEHITGWAFASDEWEAPSAENDVREGGRFRTTMAAKDKSAGFDFTGTYTKVEEPTLIEYTIDDGRAVSTRFERVGDGTTKITQSFEAESENPRDFQQAGWQSILDNFARYAQSH